MKQNVATRLAPCPPHGAVPVNLETPLEFFILGAPLAFGNGCDCFSYAGPVRIGSPKVDAAPTLGWRSDTQIMAFYRGFVYFSTMRTMPVPLVIPADLRSQVARIARKAKAKQAEVYRLAIRCGL